MSTVVELSESFPAKTEPRSRRATFPAMKSAETDLELNFPGSVTKANSCPDNWVTCLLKDLPSIL